MATVASEQVSIRRASARLTLHRRRVTSRVIANLLLLLIGVIFLIPMLWMLLASVSGSQSLQVQMPDPWTTSNFSKVLTWDTTFLPMLNGLYLCGGGTLITVVVAILAAYPLSRYKSKLKRPFLLTILFATGLPITAIMIPVYTMFNQINLIDSMPATTLFMGASALPYSIWLMKNFMDGVPMMLEEAAWTDGATAMQTLRRIVLPLMWPGVIVVTIFTFVGMWGNFFIPFILLVSQEQMPASVSIYTFFDPHGTVAYGQLAAFSILYCVPIAVLYIVLSRKLGGTFALGGALKG
jgi:multiple sugar transport system permease protein